MKILVTGGRKYGQKQEVWDDQVCWVPDVEVVKYFNDTLDAIHARKEITCVVHGGASGADTLAKEWAVTHLVPHKEYMAEWSKFGNRAGPLRNARMLDENPDIKCVLSFPGGFGTANCVTLAKSRKVNVLPC